MPCDKYSKSKSNRESTYLKHAIYGVEFDTIDNRLGLTHFSSF